MLFNKTAETMEAKKLIDAIDELLKGEAHEDIAAFQTLVAAVVIVYEIKENPEPSKKDFEKLSKLKPFLTDPNPLRDVQNQLNGITSSSTSSQKNNGLGPHQQQELAKLIRQLAPSLATLYASIELDKGATVDPGQHKNN